MIGTNMVQTMISPTAMAPRRRGLTRGCRAVPYGLAACAALLLALTTPAQAQNAPAPSPPASSPPASAPAATPADVGKQLFPSAPPTPLPNMAPPAPPTSVPGAGQGAAGAGKQLFPGAPKNPLPTSPDALTAPANEPADTRGLDQDIQGLKKDVVDLNRDLFILEEELLFPANTQVAVFLSVDVGDFFALDAVQLKLDQKEVINYLYTPRERDALLKGGVQRLYLGNLKVGPHELVAFFSGSGPNARAYKRGASLRFEKGVGAKYLELKINDRQRKLEPLRCVLGRWMKKPALLGGIHFLMTAMSGFHKTLGTLLL
jgi:hypothetical protein